MTLPNDPLSNQNQRIDSPSSDRPEQQATGELRFPPKSRASSPKETSPIRSEPLAEETLDRLVDGELSPEDRRWLLQQLDSMHDGWKRCARAFLEAQAISETLRFCRLQDSAALGSIPFQHGDSQAAATNATQVEEYDRVHDHASSQAANAKEIETAVATTVESTTVGLLHGRKRRLIGQVLGVAMAVVLMFGVFFVGTRLGESWEALRWQMTENELKPMQLTAPAPDARTIAGVTRDGGPKIQSSRSAHLQPAIAQAKPRDHQQMLAAANFDGPGDGSASKTSSKREPVWLPANLQREIDARVPQPYSPEQLELLRRQGWRIDQNRQLMAIPLGDGRQMVIPVDSLQYRYRRSSVY